MVFPKLSSFKSKVMVRIVLGVIILAAGVAGMQLLAKMKKPPAEVSVKESKLRVEVLQVKPENVAVFIKGFGEVIAINKVNVAPEVSGKIQRVHPRLELGQIVGKGDVLFEIDSQDYLATYEEAFAATLQAKNTIVRLNTDQKNIQKRLKTLVRNRELVKADFERLKRLYTVNKIGTKSDVDRAERAFNSGADLVAQMEQSLAIYPLQIKETEYLLRSANARLSRTETNVRRCAVTAPFAGRIKSVNIEVGQFVTPGMGVITLVDDAALEMHVPLDSADAREWLRFDKGEDDYQGGWFSALNPLPVEIRWTEDIKGYTWQGHLDRVIRYDKQTRTLTLAIRVDKPLSLTNGTLPLVEGMFCAVTIPGKSMKQVFRLPRWAVSFKNTVFVAEDDRLKTIPVEFARIQNDEVFVSHGLQTGDKVITTRLIDPLENSLLDLVKP